MSTGITVKVLPLFSQGPQGTWYWFSLLHFLFSKRKWKNLLSLWAKPTQPHLLLSFFSSLYQVFPAARGAAGINFLCFTFFFKRK